jgi:hypothetical protein
VWGVPCRLAAGLSQAHPLVLFHLDGATLNVLVRRPGHCHAHPLRGVGVGMHMPVPAALHHVGQRPCGTFVCGGGGGKR